VIEADIVELSQREIRHDQVKRWRPRRDSNSRSRLRRAVLYPLSYGGYSIDILLAR
jgi:hypothetical protein